jgi:site-specific DNA-methyltransferase (adenine-specific)
MTYKIINEDINKWSEDYDGELFHAMFCDAPYHLTTITKRFGKEGSAPAKFGTDGAFGRVAKGFMGQEWDGGDVAFRPETWAGMKKHLYPGAFGMTFGGSRTAHRIACAIEDVGFIIHPQINWVYGSGFPKATRVKGHEEFDGHRYGLQALKPASEPIIVFQKPYDSEVGNSVANITSTGAGALNIDGGRIPLEQGESYNINRFDDGMKPFGNGAGHKYTSEKVKERDSDFNAGFWKSDGGTGKRWNGSGTDNPLGRWPSNFIIDDTVSNSLDAQSGNLKSGTLLKKHNMHESENVAMSGKNYERHSNKDYLGDSGGASRFFFNVQTNFDEADPFVYEKKVSQKERNAGMGDEKNTHPTLKSVSLTKYLSTLLLPPIEYAPRRLLVPFSGVSSEMIGALLSGWEYVEGVELTPEYIPIAHKRLEHWIK